MWKAIFSLAVPTMVAMLVMIFYNMADILASFDPVAVDQASIDLAFAAEGSESL